MMEDLECEITEHRQSEEGLKQAADEWRTTFNSITDLVSIHDRDFRILRVNKAFADTFKMKPEEITGKPCYEVIHGTKEPPSFCPHRKALDTKEPQREEFFESHLGVYIEVSTSLIFDENGEVIATVHIVKDITERKKSEEKVAWLAKFPSENPNPILRISRESTVLYTNKAGENLLATLKTCTYVKKGKPLPDQWLKLTIDTLDSGSNREIEFECGGKTLSLTFVPFADAGYVNVYALDITERKKAEEALEISNRDLSVVVSRLGELNRELKDFVFIASHDLREPLRKISSFGGLLEESLEGKLKGDDKENLEFMVDGANRMTEMIEGLAAYSRVSTKESPFEVLDLNEIVKQLKQLELAVMLEETGGAIKVPQPLLKVKGNPVQIRQLLQNLVANGLRYRREGVPPRIVIRAKQISEEKIRIEVEDNGIGVKEQYYKDIFTMFKRLHSKQEYEGTGIGLAVCKKIVDKHGGQIGVESKYGEGSTFWFTLSPAEEAVAVS